MTTVYRFKSPLSKEDAANPRAGDMVYLSGPAYEIKSIPQYNKILEMARKDPDLLPLLRGATVCHTFSSTQKRDSRWALNYFGFITSYGLSNHVIETMRIFENRAVVGKAGMSDSAMRTMGDVKCIYLAGINGCSAYYTPRVECVDYVYADLIPGGLLRYEFRDLGPLVVTMDTYGRSLHKEVDKIKRAALKEILG